MLVRSRSDLAYWPEAFSEVLIGLDVIIDREGRLVAKHTVYAHCLYQAIATH